MLSVTLPLKGITDLMTCLAKSLSICLLILLCCSQYSQAQEYSKEELLGRINPADHKSFELVPVEYCSRGGIYLRTEALDAFLKLRKAAEDENIELIVVSGARSFTHQKSIWERKWARPRYMGWSAFEKATDILTYSSMPGTSRHHWGTDIDINSLDNDYFESGVGANVYSFLLRCGGEFGFEQVYISKDGGRTGYEQEKWHWSFMPTAEMMLRQYNDRITLSDINGFQGAAAADSIRIIEDFVNGVAK
jgi:D-alanyl-D-alanine carboxypeptidase